jgi:hypothetical protein
MALTNEELEQVRSYLITVGTDITSLPTETNIQSTIRLPAVKTDTRAVVGIPLTAIAEYIDSLNTQNNQSALKAQAAAAGAAKAQADLRYALGQLDDATESATELINNINSAILAFLRPITQEQYDALVQADELEDRPYFIYEE